MKNSTLIVLFGLLALVACQNFAGGNLGHFITGSVVAQDPAELLSSITYEQTLTRSDVFTAS